MKIHYEIKSGEGFLPPALRRFRVGDKIEVDPLWTGRDADWKHKVCFIIDKIDEITEGDYKQIVYVKDFSRGACSSIIKYYEN